MLKKILASTLSVLITATASANNFYDNTPTTTYSSGNTIPVENDIDYRHMGLYELKRRLYYNYAPTPDISEGNTNTTVVRHIHQHEHWGWGGGWWGAGPYWGGGSSSSSSSDDSSDSFTDRVGQGVKEVALVAAVVAIVATAAYGMTQAAFTLWPYVGAASLTAIELPSDSPWRITGYRVASGRVITSQYFHGNQDALEAIEEGEMFDRDRNNQGRFLLVDQENWWGLADYPTDIDVTLTRSHTDRPDEKVTVNFLRTVTNGLKPGAVTAEIIKSAKGHSLHNLYNCPMRVKAPRYFEFRKWYHLPTRVIIDLQPVGSY
ncbi:hypothetical protein M3P05_03190 [Sansalvadorimonas sp. 2012CJ34-2]|uniref:Uncharacterized protein n=1 Tax=Parendozoicomonas callyspongiae TaxID=2942213 RepID=A0ABT0PC43_9GAMM|nr:hypothetical protein [Sansalvadorimonas sp. 2012CJ34-2]MCL6268950.1 hypothetical protein [Sansalvadorimonas sp. 2012CJ34-2]